MNNLKIFLLIILFCFATNLAAQIEMNTAGNVSIGLASPTSSYDLAAGSTLLTSTLWLQGSSSIYFDFYYGSRIMRPSRNGASLVGTSSKAFGSMYSYSFRTVSDKRQKKNIKKLSGSIELLKSLEGVSFDYKVSLRCCTYLIFGRIFY